MVLVLLSLIEVSPIKINPWSRLAKIIGHALNADVMARLDTMQQRRGKGLMSTSPRTMPRLPAFGERRSCGSMMSCSTTGGIRKSTSMKCLIPSMTMKRTARRTKIFRMESASMPSIISTAFTMSFWKVMIFCERG